MAVSTTPSNYGKLVDSIKASSGPIRLGTYLASGGYVGPTQYFSGILDEVRIYSQALTAAQVLAVYQLP